METDEDEGMSQWMDSPVTLHFAAFLPPSSFALAQAPVVGGAEGRYSALWRTFHHVASAENPS